MISRWLTQHGGKPDAVLPPLGVIVADDKGPAFALFCAEPAEFPVAYLELPVSRPGLSAAQAAAAFKFAVHSIMETAGGGWSPPGTFTHFKAVVTASAVRVLLRMGFEVESGGPYIPMVFARQ